MLGHKATLGKFKKTEIISSIFSDHSTIRLEINYKKKNCKKHKHVEAKQYITKQPMDHWRNQRGNKKKYLETNENKNTVIQNLRDAAKVVLRGKFIAIQSYFRQQDKSQINILTYTYSTFRN